MHSESGLEAEVADEVAVEVDEQVRAGSLRQGVPEVAGPYLADPLAVLVFVVDYCGHHDFRNHGELVWGADIAVADIANAVVDGVGGFVAEGCKPDLDRSKLRL